MNIAIRIGLACVFLAGFHPAASAQSYLIADNQTGQILASRGKDEKRPVASLTKIATAVVVLDWARVTNADLSALATVPASALIEGAANPVGLQPGDQMSLRDLLYSALLASDNVAAGTLAEFVGARLPNASGLPPAGNFVAHMNALARSLFMKRTLFLNPTGYDAMEKTKPYSTAADLGRLVHYAYDQAAFPFYVAQASRQIHIIRAGVDTPMEITNTNELLGREEIDGVKTGRTRLAGDCVILSSKRQPESRREGEKVFVTPRRITVVLLGSNDRFGEGLALIRQGWSLYDAWAAAGRKTSRSSAL